MTQPATLRVETRALVAYGTERYEDAVTCGAVRRFLDHVGAVPAGAWGTLPDVSAKLARDWATALDHRVDQAAHGGCEFRSQHLERDGARVFGVPREIHGRHAALADLTLDGVGARECLTDPVEARHGAGTYTRGPRPATTTTRYPGTARPTPRFICTSVSKPIQRATRSQHPSSPHVWPVRARQPRQP